jgi:hypothetical protein
MRKPLKIVRSLLEIQKDSWSNGQQEELLIPYGAEYQFRELPRLHLPRTSANPEHAKLVAHPFSKVR